MEKYGFVYIWYDNKRKMYYIGCHWGSEDDGYICSSRRMRKTYRRRECDFKRRVISRVYTTRQDLLTEENKWLQLIDDYNLGKKYYNLTKHQNGHWSTRDNTTSLKEKISKRTKEAMASPEIREKYLNGMKKRSCDYITPEFLDKKSAIMKNTLSKKFPLENRKKHLPKSSNELNEVYRQKSIEMWVNRTDDEKASIAYKQSESLKKLPKVTCPHCYKVGSSGPMNRWHFNNCSNRFF